MIGRRAFVVSSIATGAALVTREALAAPTWKRLEQDPRWVQGEVAAAAAPDAVFAKLQNVPEWPRIFTDIKSMRIVERGTDHWRVKLETQTFDCGAHEYHVKFESPRTGRLWIDAPGVSAVAYMRVLAGPSAAEARVIYSLFIEARGVAGWFVSKNELDRKQEQMVVRYLADLQRVFGARPA